MNFIDIHRIAIELFEIDVGQQYFEKLKDTGSFYSFMDWFMISSNGSWFLVYPHLQMEGESRVWLTQNRGKTRLPTTIETKIPNFNRRDILLQGHLWIKGRWLYTPFSPSTFLLPLLPFFSLHSSHLCSMETALITNWPMTKNSDEIKMLFRFFCLTKHKMLPLSWGNLWHFFKLFKHYH